ncbi:MAG: M20/M25/M40 family metallo-hydrolase, partial [Bacteroidota bacterium]
MAMFIVNSSTSKNEQLDSNVPDADINYLKHIVRSIAIPRHYLFESENNAIVKQWIKDELESFGMNVEVQGEYDNLVASFGNVNNRFSVVVGAHYDSVPRSPGADDNASAIAGLLFLAKKLSADKPQNIGFIAFNREEDGLLGSIDYVNSLTDQQKQETRCAHILEMIGYADDRPGTQSVPPGLPIKIDDVGNFIAVLANKNSNQLVSNLIKIAEQHTPSLPVKCLKVFLGIEKLF